MQKKVKFPIQSISSDVLFQALGETAYEVVMKSYLLQILENKTRKKYRTKERQIELRQQKSKIEKRVEEEVNSID